MESIENYFDPKPRRDISNTPRWKHFVFDGQFVGCTICAPYGHNGVWTHQFGDWKFCNFFVIQHFITEIQIETHLHNLEKRWKKDTNLPSGFFAFFRLIYLFHHGGSRTTKLKSLSSTFGRADLISPQINLNTKYFF